MLLWVHQWTYITKKGNFDDMHNQLKNHFGTEFLKKEFFYGSYRQPKHQSGIFFSKSEILMGPTLPKLDNTPKQAMFSVC